jgi:hypothetical protein
MAGIDDIIGQWVKKAERSGELRHGKYWGKPLNLDDGFEQTPARLRMTYRILKNAGYVPYEVELLQTLADRKEAYLSVTDPQQASDLAREIAQLEQKLSVVIEGLQR